MRKLDNKSCEGLHLQVKRDSQENLKNLYVKHTIFPVVYEAKGMTFCTHVPRTCLQKRLILDFHLFARIRSQRCEFQAVHKIQPINIRYLPNQQFFKENGS